MFTEKTLAILRTAKCFRAFRTRHRQCSGEIAQTRGKFRFLNRGGIRAELHSPPQPGMMSVIKI
jgi:hypothetical protein